jgi:uroporphyrin-3 C-methyltransferase
LALILAAAAGALAVFDFTRWQQQAPENAAVAGDVADLTKQLAVIETAQRETAAGFEEEIRQLKKSEATFNTAVQEISAKLGRTTVSWRLAEVEHLLTIANARLALDRDRRTALIALENADSKLQLIDDPGLLPVRKHIVADVMALNAIDEPDIAGMALTLGSLTEAVAHLPILAKAPPGDANVEAEDDQPRTWRRMLHAAWEDLKSLVRVRRHDQPVEPLLPPDQEWYLRQNLRLKLEQARLALLSRETVLFRQTLAESGRWLTAFFDPQTPAVASLSKTLDDLGRVELNPELPDISAALRELRGHMRRLDEQVAGSGRKGGAS